MTTRRLLITAAVFTAVLVQTAETPAAAAAPGPPTAVTATTPDPNSAVVSWTSPAETSTLTGFQVIPRAAGVDQAPISVPRAVRTHVVSGLQNGTTYTFTVRSVYPSATYSSAISNSVTPFGLPGQPTSVSLQPGDREISVSWSAALANGSPISKYTVTISPADSPPVVVSGSTTSVTITALVNGKSYTAIVSATNERGTSTSSDAAPTRPVGRPDPPENVSTTGGNRTATVSWEAPVQTGGAEIDSYDVIMTSGGVTTTTTIDDATQRSFTAQNLTNGQPYSFTMTATNQAGLTSVVSASSAVTPVFTDIPVINASGVFPPGASTSGGQSIEIAGSNLAAVTGVSFECSDGTRSGTITGTPTASKVVAQAPACAAGSAAVKVSSPGGTSLGATFIIRPNPTIQSVSPNAGSRSGGYNATVTGSGFVPGRTSLRIGGRPSVIVSISSTSIVVSVPALEPGEVAGKRSISVTVDGASSLTVVLPDGFEFLVPQSSGGGGGGGGGGGTNSPVDLPRSDRIGGASRFATSAEISRQFFDRDVPVAFVATGRSFADALSAGPLALDRGPLLLVESDAIPIEVRSELERLAPRSIVVLGGPSAVADSVIASLRPFTKGAVTRLGGSTRYDTAVEISRSRFEPGTPIIFLATGENFADALAAGAAARGRGPVLLTTRDSLPQSTEKEIVRLRAGRVVILGGIAAVSENVRVKVASITTAQVSRVAGVDRFDTASKIAAEAAFATGGTVFLATGLQYADALSAAPVGSPVLLVRTDCVPEPVITLLAQLKPSKVVVLGGPSAVSTNAGEYKSC